MNTPDANGWMPIETAPKEPLSKYTQEGPTILLYGGFSGHTPRTGHWKAARTNAWRDTALGTFQSSPTHWQPLPKPPVQS